MVQLSRLAKRKGDVDMTIWWLERVKFESRAAVTNQLELLEAFLELGRHDEAITLANELETTHPRNLKVLLGVGRAHLANRDRNRATRAFREMAMLAGYGAEQLHRIAQYQMAANDRSGASWSIQKALQDEPDYLPALVLSAELQLRGGDYPMALRAVNRLKTAHPDATEAHLLAGRVLKQMGRLDEAIVAFEEGMRRKPGSALAIAMSLSKFEAAGDDPEQQEQALGELAAWLASNPRDFEAMRHYAGAHVLMGRLEEAISLYERLRRALPNDAGLLNALAVAYQKIGDERALSLAENALELAPGNPAVQDGYAWILVEQDKFAEALPYLRKARVQAPSNPEVRYHLGVALHGLARNKEAIIELRTAVSRGGEFEGRERASKLLRKLIATDD
jgi:putative PEP-CTERM system TPR-repeat lipoprotein